jgi:protocatechuate 3,4-dioxygenase alpha subunit
LSDNPVVTPSQTIGPFFHFALTDRGSVARMAAAEAIGEKIQLICRVLDGDNVPAGDAMIELWQADASGRYGETAFGGYGRLSTNEDGVCVFDTVRPGRVVHPGGKLQAPHIAVSIFARGLLDRLVTRIYFAGDPANDCDPVLALVPDDRRGALMACPEPGNPAAWRFDIRLCSECETVFFEI